MRNPKVSIVLPCYNGAGYLSESIHSCIEQSFTNWELIIVNDCSTDNSMEIATEYARQDSRIKVYTNDVNKKLPASLNVGFSHATGDYLTWTSHDNIMHKDMLKDFVDYLEGHEDVGLVTANYTAIDANGKELYTVSQPDSMLYMPRFNTVCYAFMYRRKVLETVGGYNENLFLIEDYEYWVRIWQKFKIEKIEKVLYYTRVDNKTLTMTRKAEIAERLLYVRLQYFDSFDAQLKKFPKLRRDFFISIVNEIHSLKKVKYVLSYTLKSPCIFGMYYIFWYRPKQIMKHFDVYYKIRLLFKPCQK